MKPRMQKGDLEWSPDAWAAVWAAARRAYPNEACGALLGVDSVSGVVPLANVSGSPATHYEIAVADLLKVHEEEDLLGWFHSHPRTSSDPSELDLAYAVPGYVYVVCGIDGATTFQADTPLEG